ncbi:MAG: biopolymer transporter ExbD [Verrucomicrobiota bacterium]
MKGRHLGKDDEATDINISPLIDMVFILLIFFIVTTVFVEEDGMAANTPDPAPPTVEEPDEDPLVILIKDNGQIMAKQGGPFQEIGKRGIRAKVSQEMQRKHGEKKAMTLSVEPNVPMQLVVFSMDECLLAGADSVSIKTVSN